MARDGSMKFAIATLTKEQRALAMQRFAVLQPRIEDEVALARAARDGGVSVRTAERWLARYRETGLAGLSRPLVDGCAQGAAVLASCGLDVLQGHDLAGMFLAHPAAEEPIAVENSDFGHIAGVVSDGDGVTDIGRQGRMAGAQPLEMDAIPPHDARFGMHPDRHAGHGKTPVALSAALQPH